MKENVGYLCIPNDNSFSIKESFWGGAMSNQFFCVVLCCAVLQPFTLYTMEDFYLVLDEFESEHDDTEDSAQDRLMMGIEHNYLNRRSLRGLIRQGADIHKNDDRPLHTAVLKGHVNMINLLLAEGANIHVYDGDILKLAVASKKAEAVWAILNWSKKENVGSFSASLVYILLNEAWSQQLNQIAMQLDEYLRFLQENKQLLRAISDRENNRVRRLLRGEATVFVCNGLSLIMAVSSKNVYLVQLLLEYAQPSNGGVFPLNLIISCIHLLTTKTPADEEIFDLLKVYLRRNWTTRQLYPSFELHAAVLKGDHIVAQRWLLLGADIHYLNDNMINLACTYKYKEIVQLFLRWSFKNDQLYDQNFIRTLILETKDRSPSIEKLLETYEKDLEIISRPER